MYRTDGSSCVQSQLRSILGMYKKEKRVVNERRSKIDGGLVEATLNLR